MQATAEPLKNLTHRSMISCRRAPTSLVKQYGCVPPVARQAPTRVTCQGTLSQHTSSSLAYVATSVENSPRQGTRSEATLPLCIRMSETLLFDGIVECSFNNMWSKAEVFAGGHRTVEELDSQINTLMRKIENNMGHKMWECLTCGKMMPGKNDMSRHVESTHIEFPGVSCHLCGKHSKTRNALRNHIYAVHNDAKTEYYQ